MSHMKMEIGRIVTRPAKKKDIRFFNIKGLFFYCKNKKQFTKAPKG
jgi:hypothetical protein